MSRKGLFFPGQGAQYVGMGRDFYEAYKEARLVFEEADDRLQFSISKIIFEGPLETITRTDCSQLAIFITSLAILKVIQTKFSLSYEAVAGLSLGEYSALFAAGKADFQQLLLTVQKRGEYMSTACDENKGTMAVLLGLNGKEVEAHVQAMNLPNDLWVANFNCPGQVVVSGTLLGIQKVTEVASTWGVKRVIPLKVHGAFHSGLMESAKKKLIPFIEQLQLQESSKSLYMNVPGDLVIDRNEMKKALQEQVTHPVRFENDVQAMIRDGVTFGIEIGPGSTLSGILKKIGMPRQVTVSKIEDLKVLEEELSTCTNG